MLQCFLVQLQGTIEIVKVAICNVSKTKGSTKVSHRPSSVRGFAAHYSEYALENCDCVIKIVARTTGFESRVVSNGEFNKGNMPLGGVGVRNGVALQFLDCVLDMLKRPGD